MLEKIAEVIKNECDNYFEADIVIEHVGGGNGEQIKVEFEEGGRWSNYEITTFRIQSRYFKFRREVPATEMQEGGYFSRALWEVYPKEVTVTKYLSKKNDPTIEWSQDD